MRSVLSVSLDSQTIQMAKEQSKRYGFDNVSKYIRSIIHSYDEDIITEDELLRDMREAEKEYREGKTIKAKSIADLLW